jgi:hypothetical protein
VATHVSEAGGNDVTGSLTVLAGTVVNDEATMTRTASRSIARRSSVRTAPRGRHVRLNGPENAA